MPPSLTVSSANTPPGGNVKIVLVNMPWASIDVPSLALGILRAAALRRLPQAQVEVVHANLDFVDWLDGRVEFTVADYHYYSLHSYFSGVGDWVFSSALNGQPEWQVDAFTGRMREAMPDQALQLTLALHRLAPAFVTELAERLLHSAPDVVAFTSTFQQNVASLAVARILKQRSAATMTFLGGANCDGAQGAALHRNFPFIDFVVRGEGEETFPVVLDALADHDALADQAVHADQDKCAAQVGGPGTAHELRAVPGLCWRTAKGESVANPMPAASLAPEAIITPDYTGYPERLAASRAHAWVEPKLVVEGARGCWWGEKHQCTFCGLNGSTIRFRSKHPARFGDEVIELARRHQILDMFVVDNIIDMGYLDTVVPALAASGYDLRLQYEIKSNLRGRHLQALAEAGIVSVQPGIENLSSKVLRIMDKGVTGCQNVRMLRDAETAGLTVAWNYLYGFPGEGDEDYAPAIAQIPALHHLAPAGGSTRIAIERFSPYFERPELGFAEIHPHPQYAQTYDVPEGELAELAYLFTAPDRGICGATETALAEAISRWGRSYPQSRLTADDLGDAIVLVSRRPDFDWHVHQLEDPFEVALFRLLDQPRTPDRAAAHLGVEPGDVGAVLNSWRELGIVFTDDGQWVHVVPAARNQHVLRIPLPADDDAAAADELGSRR